MNTLYKVLKAFNTTLRWYAKGEIIHQGEIRKKEFCFKTAERKGFIKPYKIK